MCASIFLEKKERNFLYFSKNLLLHSWFFFVNLHKFTFYEYSAEYAGHTKNCIAIFSFKCIQYNVQFRRILLFYCKKQNNSYPVTH